MGTGYSFAEDLRLASQAEELGFDGFYLPEHHQESYWPSAPLITLAGIATRTSRIRLGTGVTIMGLHHPVRLAEETATLDRISDGRLTLGAGLGYQGRDFAALGVDPAARVSLLEEGIEALRLAWTKRPFTFSGRRFEFRDVSIYPAPVQEPHPPIWLAAWTKAGVRRAARIADGWLTDPIHGLEAICALAEEYRRAAREAGKTPHVVLMRQFAVAPEDAAGTILALGELVTAVWRYYWRNGSFNFELEPEWQAIADPQAISADAVIPKRVPFGNPGECARDFQEWMQALEPDYVIAVPTPSGAGAGQVAEMVRLLGSDIIPALRRA